jgi:hypothetical protein
MRARWASVLFAVSIPGLLFVGLLLDSATAEPVPFNCMMLPGEELASVLITNSLASGLCAGDLGIVVVLGRLEFTGDDAGGIESPPARKWKCAG